MISFRLKTIFLLAILFSFSFRSYSLAEHGSAGPVSVLDIVKGTALLKIQNKELLNNDLRQIFTGKDGLKKNKLIRVEGVNDGNEIMLNGTGLNGEGYEFTLSTSSGNCGVSPATPGKVIRETIPFPYPFSIGFDSVSAEIEPDVDTNDKYKCFGTNGKATLKANFQDTENSNLIINGKFNLKFTSSIGLSDQGIEECAPFPSSSNSTNTNDDEKYIEDPDVINVKLENIPSNTKLNNPNAFLTINVKVEVTNSDILQLEASTATPDYNAAAANGVSITDTGTLNPNITTVTIVSQKNRTLLNVPILVGLPSCITFNLRPVGSMAGSSKVIVKEVLDPTGKVINGVRVTQSEEMVQITCNDPNDCE